ncbi:hypothetical protein GCM10011502_00670 [Oceanisphaera marina]|uniref:Uncharacterized protein n=1 Tax=Oceanisphaera marina TaxID=2017550 RepID=A0ABQ1IBU2_9GAMM|nr:hypothetical protein [Oceanisphaera marina]GGB31569.1 hypothetical protein GCM10011502_00670 [Oceanisphaera marina]
MAEAIEAGAIAHKTLAELRAMHTGTLMNRRQALLKCPETSTLTARDKASLLLPIRFKDTAVWQNAYRDLKSVLDTREHQPTKQQRKALRQARAKKR